MRLLHGDALAVLAGLEAASVHAIVTDPPYGLEFMGKEWDSFKTRKDKWQGCISAEDRGENDLFTRKGFKTLPEFRSLKASAMPAYQEWCRQWAVAALRVARPGAHLLAFGGTRTFHRLTCAIEDAGWEIRDCIMWVYGSGFPKSHNLDGAWQGWGTALKPAWEPIIVARKPLSGTVAANVAAHGCGAINVDGCRIPGGDVIAPMSGKAILAGTTEGWDRPWKNDPAGLARRQVAANAAIDKANSLGRWPANVAHDGSEEVLALFPQSDGQQAAVKGTEPSETGVNCYGRYARGGSAAEPRGDSGSAARFFYCAKASRSEREAGLDSLPVATLARSGGAQGAEADGEDYENAQGIGLNRVLRVRNNHPTVKPLALMTWLVKLVTPPGGTALDPFMGSGTTGIAASRQGFDFIGIDSSAEYVELARRRIVGDAPLFAEGGA